uniref:Vomeronasal type-1 receptor n=1 Tax=Leptobrachium leishanense TaxID=445787 RepID=A0A8C5MDQ4_9ANUR
DCSMNALQCTFMRFSPIGFIPLVVIGVPGNVYIIVKFMFIRLVEKKLLPTNMILMALALVNLFLLLARSIPQYMYVMFLEHLLGDAHCKLIVYSYRVCRGTSISFTSLLSCHQCILIAPVNKLWAYFKQKLAQKMVLIIVVILFINLFLYSSSLAYAHAKKNSTYTPFTLRLITCHTDFLTYTSFFLNGTLLAIKDFLLVGLMTLASSYMVNLLLRHQQAIKGIRSSDNGQTRSKEYKASRAVISLVVLYVVLYGFDNSLWFYSMFHVQPDLNDARIVLACSYAALSPVLMIATHSKLRLSNCSSRKMLLGSQICNC